MTQLLPALYACTLVQVAGTCEFRHRFYAHAVHVGAYCTSVRMPGCVPPCTALYVVYHRYTEMTLYYLLVSLSYHCSTTFYNLPQIRAPMNHLRNSVHRCTNCRTQQDLIVRRWWNVTKRPQIGTRFSHNINLGRNSKFLIPQHNIRNIMFWRTVLNPHTQGKGRTRHHPIGGGDQQEKPYKWLLWGWLCGGNSLPHWCPPHSDDSRHMVESDANEFTFGQRQKIVHIQL